MFSHDDIWTALDKIAEKNRLSVSGLSKLAGLDPTSFNKSKRVTGNGRLRWPSTESISKVLACTNTSVEIFAALLLGRDPDDGINAKIPLINLADAGGDACFDDAGFPAGENWEEMPFPRLSDSFAYALKVTDDSMLPVYQNGDVMVISPDVQVRRGDRIIVRLHHHHGSLTAMILLGQSANMIEFASLDPQQDHLTFDARDIDWMARIVWATQ